MFTANERQQTGGRRPDCLAGAQSEAIRLAAWRKAWDQRVCCCGTTRSGEPCKNQRMRGALTCRLHGPAGGQRHPLKKPPTPMAEHARLMRRLWRADPWANGYTVRLDTESKQRLSAWALGVGIHLEWLSPRVQDLARWGYLNLCRSGRHPDVDAGASDGLAARIRAQDLKDGPESTGHHANRTAASRVLARYRVVPPLGEKERGWSEPPRKRPKRVAGSAAQQLARDRALAALPFCESREQAVQRQLALDRVRRCTEREEEAQRDERKDFTRDGPFDRDGW